MSIQFQPGTIVALSTPPGTGALGIIRLSGPDALSISNLFFKGRDLTKVPTHTIHFGTIRDGNEIIDEVVASIFLGPKSFTGENTVEFSCHGSPYILQQILDLAIKKGARLALPGEFTLRAFLNGKMDLSQAEAVADLIASQSKVAHQTAMRQMRGGFSQELQDLREQLIHFAALVELELDFAEEDVEFADRSQMTQLVKKIRTVLVKLISSFSLGNVIKEGVATVIAGRPNAGKSTLLNALLNEERAIVSEIPGTTRDTIEENLTINGIRFRLIDTAGIREAGDVIEAMGVKRTMEEIEKSTLLIYVYDSGELTEQEVQQDLKKLHHDMLKIIIVANKCDKIENSTSPFNISPEHIYLSAQRKTNLDELRETLYQSISENINPLEQTIVTNARHADALRRADAALDEVETGIQNRISGELFALDIRRALDALGEITGGVSSDEILGAIFSKFCIGK